MIIKLILAFINRVIDLTALQYTQITHIITQRPHYESEWPRKSSWGSGDAPIQEFKGTVPGSQAGRKINIRGEL